ncbi:methionyl-tRNA formyltransferase [Bombilactobacillus folatiphilus]|uniref:Methionyl-tRNA formyltransferase n=1 Tax=Bombilactobacillus folatiphilus TaxID=2923362 RepID=A0ABY4P7E6_9LACO|nr:methionyl-tRNA formyltransferase [Bombilactobacillus folatiphilus]UQS81619.1 methionyl-tRNA formyltransferase [Bombilactobacillus folatiphilus]
MTKIIFMGTPAFSVTVLEGLLQAQYEIVAVVTQPDRQVGRKKRLEMSPVKKFALAHDLLVLQPEKLSGSPELTTLIDLHPDLIVTAAFGQFVPTKLLKAAQIAAINVHGSLLPHNRGGAPIQRSIMNGDQQTGITIMYMVAQMDAGDIISQQSIEIDQHDTSGSLFAKLAIVGRDLLLQTIPQIVAGTNKRFPQDESQVTVTPNLKPDEEQIDIQQAAAYIDRQVRGLNPDPVAYLMVKKQRVKVYQISVGEQTTTAKPGTIVERTKHQLGIAAGDNSIIYLERLQPAGKNVMMISDYLNGNGKDLQVGDQIN